MWLTNIYSLSKQPSLRIIKESQAERLYRRAYPGKSQFLAGESEVKINYVAR